MFTYISKHYQIFDNHQSANYSKLMGCGCEKDPFSGCAKHVFESVYLLNWFWNMLQLKHECACALKRNINLIIFSGVLSSRIISTIKKEKETKREREKERQRQREKERERQRQRILLYSFAQKFLFFFFFSSLISIVHDFMPYYLPNKFLHFNVYS